MNTLKNVPAFPTHFDNGMTLRDYFAIKAPEEIPTWFDPQYPVPQPQIPCLPPHWDERMRKDYEGLGDWLNEEDVAPEIVEFRGLVIQTQEKITQWAKDKIVFRYFTWRWHYAESMLRTREEA